MKMGVVAKPYLDALKICSRLIDYAIDLGFQVHVYKQTLSAMTKLGLPINPKTKVLDELSDRASLDLLAIIGGDGTLLRTLHKFRRNPPPILAIRYGKRGFLLDIGPNEIHDRLVDLLKDRYFTIDYIRLEATVENYAINPPFALNEVAILHLEPWKMIRLNVCKDNVHIFDVNCDGLIVSTPAGSTAYSLSVGGPIVEHSVKALIITPIAPQQLDRRPIVVEDTSIVTVKVEENSPSACLVIDGVNIAELKPGSIVKVRKAQSTVKIIRFRKEWFYERLHKQR